MSDERLAQIDRAAALHRDFDQSFAEPRRLDAPASEDLLAVRLGSGAYALRLSEIAGVFADRQISPLPGRVPALLGIAGFRGVIVPVYDLDGLLGHPPVETMRWLAMAAAAPVAFAFVAPEGHLRLPREAIAPREAGANDSSGYVRDFARTSELVRPIVHLPSILTALGNREPDNTETPEN